MAARDPANGSCYYGWMLQGEALFQNLEPSHPLLTALPITGPGCFETFPHAITLHQRGGHATAANKLAQGSELLEQAGIGLASLTSIERIDAALCCLAVLLSCVAKQPITPPWEEPAMPVVKRIMTGLWCSEGRSAGRDRPAPRQPYGHCHRSLSNEAEAI